MAFVMAVKVSGLEFEMIWGGGCLDICVLRIFGFLSGGFSVVYGILFGVGFGMGVSMVRFACNVS